MTDKSDPTLPLRQRAKAYDRVEQGTSCSQTAFKTGGKAFFYVGEQGGRFKTMFKLDASRGEAEGLAQQFPQDYQLGSGPWVTARFSADQPMPVKRWQKWLDESYALSCTKK